MQINTNAILSSTVVDRILKEAHVRVGCAIPLEYITHNEVVDRVYPAMEDMLIQLQTSVYQEDLSSVETLVVRTPKTWFDHFKQDHFPKWLLEKYPVKYNTETKTIDLTFSVRYPDFHPANKMPYVVVREIKYNHAPY